MYDYVRYCGDFSHGYSKLAFAPRRAYKVIG
jgi:hypothetical protein